MTTLQLYNSFSRQVEPFRPLGDPVTLYVCGITPYDTTHLGHAFTYVANDILVRFLEYSGRTVRYVQNVTDIDDDLLQRAARDDENWRDLGDRWTRHFIHDMAALNVRPPDEFPRATDAIELIQGRVASLLAAGVAYESGGSVYFDIDAWEAFGKLSRLDRDEMLPIANERGNHPDDTNKRRPLDFVLWQAQAEGEPAWESPWGPGRPGWHIECSTLATELLGASLDLHSGGADLLFPHHECEIAQVEPITRESPFVRHWLHTAMVRHAGEKMSKSLGNLVMVRDLLEQWSPDALRLYLGTHHYRRPWSHDETELQQAAAQVERMKEAVAGRNREGEELSWQAEVEAFEAGLNSDLDTQAAARAIMGLADKILDGPGGSTDGAREALRRMASVLGLRLEQDAPESRVKVGWERHLARFGGSAG